MEMKKKLAVLMSVVVVLGICIPQGATRAAADGLSAAISGESTQESPLTIPSQTVGDEVAASDASIPAAGLPAMPALEGKASAGGDPESSGYIDGGQAAEAQQEEGVAPEVLVGAAASDGTLREAADDSVYVNGSAGDDANPGTKEAPVKTFDRAKELLQANNADAIYVTGTLRVAGTESWDLDGKSLVRDPDYHGELVNVSSRAHLELADIVIDGNSADGATGIAKGGGGNGGSLIGVYGSSTLTIGSGAILQNNSVESKGNWYPEGGGAVFADSSTVNVEGGTVRNNEAVYGGGIFATYNSVVNMSDGVITGNRAIQGASSSAPADYSGCGGGICAANGADVNFSGGTFSDNSAFERGGAISMGTYFASETNSPTLIMTGGTISSNSAGVSGGGIFVQAGLSSEGNGGTPTYAIARITAGTISGNAVTAQGKGSAMFGGAGIYVNGYSSAYSAFHNGELHLDNVEVSGNHAAIAGGGYAGCPVSVTEIHLTNGAVFYENTTDTGSATEVYVLASNGFGAHSGNPAYSITPAMLGGGAYRWTYDDGTEVPLNQLQGRLNALQGQSLSLNNNLTAGDAGVQKALALAKVHITDNTSVTRGGGIGTNGTVIIGEAAGTTEISTTKIWADAGDKDGLRPESVRVDLYRDGEYVGYQTMRADADGVWETTFKNLPKADVDGTEYAYTVEERPVEGYTAGMGGSAAEGYAITNVRTVTVTGTKTWNDGEGRDGGRPSSVTVNLMRDQIKVESRVVTAEDGWKFSFDGLSKYDSADGHEYAYTVTEEPVDGYSSQVSGDAASGYVITNSKVEVPVIPGGFSDGQPSGTPENATREVSDVPDTGDDSWMLALAATLAGVGAAAALTMGARLRRSTGLVGPRRPCGRAGHCVCRGR